MTTAYMIPISIDGGTTTTIIAATVTELVGRNIGFTEIPAISTGTASKAVQYNNLIIDFSVDSGYVKVKFYVNTSQPILLSLINISPYVSNGNENPKAINVCVVKSGDTFMAINFASKGVYPGNGTYSAFNSKNGSVELCYASNGTGYFADGNQCEMLLKRTYRQAEGVFFCNEGLPVKDTSTGEFVSDLPDVYNLGGAQIGKWYKMTDNTDYYGVMNNIAVVVDEVVRPQTSGS